MAESDPAHFIMVLPPSVLGACRDFSGIYCGNLVELLEVD